MDFPFLFPYGPDCLFADLTASNLNGNGDRRFFARGGELLYLMLNRSSKGPKIADLISKNLLRQDEAWNRVIHALLPEDHLIDDNSASYRIGYLPFAKRQEYEDLAETWTRILNLNLSGEALLDPLMRVSSLHMLLYMLRRATEEIKNLKEIEGLSEPKFVLEIASPHRTTLFELSKENFRTNRILSTSAVRAYVDSAKKDQRWHDAQREKDPASTVRKYLAERYEYKWEPEDKPLSSTPEALLETLRDDAEERHQKHVHKVHLEWTKRID